MFWITPEFPFAAHCGAALCLLLSGGEHREHHALDPCPCTTRHRPSSLETFGEQWELLEGSPGILCHLPTSELLILNSPVSLLLLIFCILSPPFPEPVVSPVLESFKDLSGSPLQGAQPHSRSLGNLEYQGNLEHPIPVALMRTL